jgi:hypothetical protein
MRHKPSFARIYYKGKPLKRDMSTKTLYIVMQKNNPERLDMRYKDSRRFAAMNREAFK